mmetsp:Transcript_956/g.1037  ORF Transcript_956/g.1037 Transcript_956/m.1037 type:complete len:146 (-) Transcript_956:90-527(-)
MPLIGQTNGEDVLFVAAAVLQLTMLITLFQLAFSHWPFSQIKSLLNTIIKAISTWRMEVGTSEMELLVQKRLQEQKLLQFRHLCQFICFSGYPITINLMVMGVVVRLIIGRRTAKKFALMTDWLKYTGLVLQGEMYTVRPAPRRA